MKQLLCLLILYSVFVTAYGQKFSYKISAGIHQESNYSSTTTSQYETQFIDLNAPDSLIITINNLVMSQSTNDFYATPAFYFALNFDMQLSDKWSLATGWRLQSQSFRTQKSQSGFTVISELGRDTILRSENDNGGAQGTPCTNILNFQEYDDDDYYDIISLSIPITLSYALSERLNLHSGAFIQTPLYSRLNFNTGLINRDDNNFCTLEIKNIEQDAGPLLNNLQLGLSLSADYRIWRHISLELGLRKQLNSVFATPVSNSISFAPSSRNADQYLPLSFFAGVRFRFGKSPTEEN